MNNTSAKPRTNFPQDGHHPEHQILKMTTKKWPYRDTIPFP